jgi:hypothetical protein
MDMYNLFIALIVLICLLIIIFLGYVLNHHVRREPKSQTTQRENDIEANLPTQRPSRPEVLHEHYDQEQRLSHLTTVAPSIELLPEIRTSSDRAEDWLDRRDSRVTDGDLGLKTIKMLAVEDGSDSKWGRKGRQGGDGNEARKDVTEKVDEKVESPVARKD